MSTKLLPSCLSLWRPPFDTVEGKGWLCFRSRGSPVQPLTQQFLYELNQLRHNPCAFAHGSASWREIFAVSSVSRIPAGVLLCVRWLSAAIQLWVAVSSVARGWRMLYYFTTWNTILASAYFLLLSLCSTTAILRRPSPPQKFVTEEAKQTNVPGGEEQLPVLLRVVESVSSVVVGASFITCVVYWTAIWPTVDETTWLSYYEHLCFIPVLAMALVSRIPYRLQHIWLAIFLAACFDILCCIVAFVPLTTWKGKVGYMYSVMQYQTKPVQAWIITFCFTIFLTPLSYVIFWFPLRYNNPEAAVDRRAESCV